ncbi:MAG: hypothetical protein LBT01_04660 [Spirochaetaceae bacterium]|jgi:hypothetical protein|nr:hypothetical protein [Spirochaetaceae bacterium]
MSIRVLFFALFSLFFLQTGVGEELTLSRIEGAFGFDWKYNRTTRNHFEMFSYGSVQANNIYTVDAGFLFNGNHYFDESVSFLGAELSLSKVPVSFFTFLRNFNIRLLYIYDAIPEYRMRSHSLIPSISFNSKYVEVSLGPHWRWTSFLGEAAILEGQAALSLVITPFTTEKWTAGINIANFDEYFPGGLWDFYLKIFCNYRLSKQLSLDNALYLYQSGIDGWTVTFYGFKARSALTLAW